MVYRAAEAQAQSPGDILSLSLGTDRARVAAQSKTRLHCVAEITAAAEGLERQRPPLSLIFVLDVSGSMAGPPLEHVVMSVDRMVGLLEPTDKVGVVAFSDNAAEVVSLQSLTPEVKSQVRARVHRLAADGHTHLESGIRKAVGMFPPRVPHERQALLVLSDGVPNRGIASPSELLELAKSYRPAVSISTLGYGAHHHEDTLSAVSNGGGGRYHYIADPSICAFEFAQAIGTQGDIVAEGVELLLSLSPGVELSRFLGKPQVRFRADGLSLALPDMFDGSISLSVAEITVEAPREPGPFQVANATLVFRKAGEKNEQRLERAITIDIGHDEGALIPEVNAQVLRAKSEEVRAEARVLADRGQFEGAAAMLRQFIRVIEASPGFSQNDGSKLADAYELLLDEAMAMERKPSMEDYQRFRKTQMAASLLTEGSSVIAPRSVTVQSKAVMAGIAGNYPKAHLLILDGPEPGRRIALGPRQVIGRTKMSEIPVADPSVSRQHTQIIAQGGAFYVVDLGSTNVTELNGQPLRDPRKLSHGDVLQVGKVLMRYVEEAPGK